MMGLSIIIVKHITHSFRSFPVYKTSEREQIPMADFTDYIFTARQRSWGVCQSFFPGNGYPWSRLYCGGWVSLVSNPFQGLSIPGTRSFLKVDMPGPRSLTWGWVCPGVGMSRGWVPIHPQTWTREGKGERRGGEGKGRGSRGGERLVPITCYLHLVVATTYAVSKQAVRILLECFLVVHYF